MSTKKKQQGRKKDSAALKDDAPIKESAAVKDNAPIKESAGFTESIQKAIKKKQEDEAKKKESAAQAAAAEVGDKLLFTGLDNSGKSSIILALQNKYSKIAILQPTRQTERTVFTYLGKQITRWDLGGQQRYRIAYLQNPAKYFDRTSVCIFILDIQDMGRVDEALGYFKDIVENFRQLNITPPVYVFLHKADPEWMMIVDDLQESYLGPIKRKFQEIVGTTHKLFFKNTSIFDPWTIMSGFSDVLLQLYPKGEVIDRSIKEFAEKLNAEGMVVLDNNALILGQYFTSMDEKDQFAILTPNVLQLFDSFRSIVKKTQKLVFTVNQGDYVFHTVTDPLRSEERYIFAKAPLSGVNDSDIEDFGNVLLDLLGKK